MSRILAVILFAILLGQAGSALADSENRLADYWTGKHSDDLVTSWGEPSKIKDRSGGARVFVYRLRFFGKREVDAPGWYMDQQNQPQNTLVTGATLVPPAVIIPGPLGTTKVKTKRKVRFLIDSHGYVHDVKAD